MTIDNLKELEKLIKLCAKLGVRTMKIDNLEFTVSPKQPAISTTLVNGDSDVFPEAQIQVPRYSPVENTEPDKIATEELTEEQLMFYSSRPEEEHAEQ